MKRNVFSTGLLLLFALPPALPAADEGGAKLNVREVLPSATDKNITKFSGDGWAHWVYCHRPAPKRGQLVVFLPGTGGMGHGAKAFCTLAANAGSHVVSLAYPSTVSMSAFHNSPDADAFLKARENVIYGKVPFEKLRIDEPNSIHNRLHKLLVHLVATYPQENWGQFLTKQGSLKWSKMVLTGQSQGGGHAALMGMQHSVARVLMFGAPKDFNIHFNRPAKWFSGASETPLNRFFSFVHSADEGHGCTYAQQLENYRALKLMPEYSVINVDDKAAPYQHSRLLTSKRPQENPHVSVINDKAYTKVWKYMLEEAVK